MTAAEDLLKAYFITHPLEKEKEEKRKEDRKSKK